MSIFLSIYILVPIINYPHYISYLNILAGNNQGYQIFTDSNLDWGQDLKRLHNWTKQENIDTLYIDYFGTADVKYYLPDVKIIPIKSDIGPQIGYTAISATMLQDSFYKKKINSDYQEYWWLAWRKPDYIIGISRGGLTPAIMLSHWFDIPMKPLQVSLRDGGECVSDLSSAEDAFGYVTQLEIPGPPNLVRSDPALRKNILIVDDINDSGATFNWIKEDWQKSCFPQETNAWNSVWQQNVRFATLTENLASEFDGVVQYVCHEINKAEEDVWLVYPWENVAEY